MNAWQAVKLLGILLALNMEALGLIVVAWWIGKWLNENYAESNVNWLPISFGISIVCIAYSWIVILKPLFRKADTSKTMINK